MDTAGSNDHGYQDEKIYNVADEVLDRGLLMHRGFVPSGIMIKFRTQAGERGS